MNNAMFTLPAPDEKGVVSVTDLPNMTSGWRPIGEAFSGAWQRGVVDTKPETLFGFSPLFRCITLIAGDISKLGVRLIELKDGIWQEAISAAFSPVLRKPNRYQTWIQFVESWILSELINGNTYVLKVRDNRQVVVALYVLDPTRVVPLVAPGAAVFYRVQADNLSTVDEAVVIPASEIIHDRMNTLFHPLIGVSPIAAASLSGFLGMEAQKASALFFKNGARPSGMLTGPNPITSEVAERIKTQWEQNFGGQNLGKVAVAGSGLDFRSIAISAIDAQLVEVLKLSGALVCHAFGVPLFKVGIGDLPANSNVAVLNQIYYADCLQKLIEGFEQSLDDGLALPLNYGVELNVKNLLRMDAKTQMETLGLGVERKILAINDGRKELGYPPVKGGEQPWMQMQDFPIEMLLEMQRRVAASGLPPGAQVQEEEPKELSSADVATLAGLALQKALMPAA